MSKQSVTTPDSDGGPPAGSGGALGHRRRDLLRAATAFAAAAIAARLNAQSWPSRPLRLILTAPPGSSIDILGRLVAEQLREKLGQPVVAENRAQAGGTLGTDAVAKAAADGYTIGLSFTGPLATAQFLYSKLPYDPARDLAPIVLVGTAPNILAVNSQLPVTTLGELIAYAKGRPGQLNYASVGNGSASHLAMELFKTTADLFIVNIPYNGAPPAVQATAARDVQMIMSNPTSLLPLIQAGRLRPLAVTGRARWATMKALPTIAESGFAGFEAIAWNGFVAPAGTPREVITRLNREINAILQSPAVKPKIEAAGWDVAGGSVETFAVFMQSERQRWQPVITRSGARVD